MGYDYKLCRREVTRPSGAVGPHNATVTKSNALGWCEACRERLPLWPADDATSATPCARCSHTKDDHDSDIGTGGCWRGSGNGNVCSCRAFATAGNDVPSVS